MLLSTEIQYHCDFTQQYMFISRITQAVISTIRQKQYMIKFKGKYPLQDIEMYAFVHREKRRKYCDNLQQQNLQSQQKYIRLRIKSWLIVSRGGFIRPQVLPVMVGLRGGWPGLTKVIKQQRPKRQQHSRGTKWVSEEISQTHSCLWSISLWPRQPEINLRVPGNYLPVP